MTNSGDSVAWSQGSACYSSSFLNASVLLLTSLGIPRHYHRPENRQYKYNEDTHISYFPKTSLLFGELLEDVHMFDGLSQTSPHQKIL